MPRYSTKGFPVGVLQSIVPLFAALLLGFSIGALTSLQFSAVQKVRCWLIDQTNATDRFLTPSSASSPPMMVASETNSLANGHENHQLKLQAALNTLSCFVTPECFPRYKCRFGQPQKIKRKLSWEEIAFCLEDLMHSQLVENTEGKEERCLVYSFGIHNNMEWETKVGKFLQCEVHAFDPTVQHDNSSLVTFHMLGLQGEGTNMSLTNGAQYSRKDPKLMLSLPDIMERLGHSDRKLDALMLDCEGCEWGVLRQLACQGDSHLVDQLIVEFHFQRRLGLANDADVIVAADAITCLRLHGWGIVAQTKSFVGRPDVNYTRGIMEILPTVDYLLFAALQRIPPGTVPVLSDVFDPHASSLINRSIHWQTNAQHVKETTRFQGKSIGQYRARYPIFLEPPENPGDMSSKI